MVGILVSLWDGLFSGAFAVSFRGCNRCDIFSSSANWWDIGPSQLLSQSLSMKPPLSTFHLHFPSSCLPLVFKGNSCFFSQTCFLMKSQVCQTNGDGHPQKNPVRYRIFADKQFLGWVSISQKTSKKVMFHGSAYLAMMKGWGWLMHPDSSYMNVESKWLCLGLLQCPIQMSSSRLQQRVDCWLFFSPSFAFNWRPCPELCNVQQKPIRVETLQKTIPSSKQIGVFLV